MKLLLTIALIIGLLAGVNAQCAKTSADGAQNGVASYYHPKFEGRRTATGEVFANNNYTAASNGIRLNTYVKVTNLRNSRVIYVKINDRMAAHTSRLMDLTQAAAEELGYRDAGTANVKMEVVPEDEGRNGVLAQREAAGSAKKNTL